MHRAHVGGRLYFTCCKAVRFTAPFKATVLADIYHIIAVNIKVQTVQSYKQLFECSRSMSAILAHAKPVSMQMTRKRSLSRTSSACADAEVVERVTGSWLCW